MRLPLTKLLICPKIRDRYLLTQRSGSDRTPLPSHKLSPCDPVTGRVARAFSLGLTISDIANTPVDLEHITKKGLSYEGISPCKSSCCCRSRCFAFLCSSSGAQSLVVLSEDGNLAWFAPSPLSAALPVDRIVRLGKSPGGPPPPPPPPTPGSELERLAATWETKVSEYRQRDDHRQALAGMYTLLSQQIVKGSFKDLKQLQKLTAQMRNMLLGAHREKWDVWGRDVAAYLGSNVSTLGAVASAFQEIAAGLDKTEALGPQLRALLLMLFRMLLERLLAEDDIIIKMDITNTAP